MQQIPNKHFVETVRMMREAQVEFFKTRGREVLQESKRLEREVDKMLTNAIEVSDGQTTLFDTDATA